jgi:hypothetical protein
MRIGQINLAMCPPWLSRWGDNVHIPCTVLLSESCELRALPVSPLESLVQLCELARKSLRTNHYEPLIMPRTKGNHYAQPFAGREEINHDCAFVRLHGRQEVDHFPELQLFKRPELGEPIAQGGSL